MKKMIIYLAVVVGGDHSLYKKILPPTQPYLAVHHALHWLTQSAVKRIVSLTYKEKLMLAP